MQPAFVQAIQNLKKDRKNKIVKVYENKYQALIGTALTYNTPITIDRPGNKRNCNRFDSCY